MEIYWQIIIASRDPNPRKVQSKHVGPFHLLTTLTAIAN